MKINYSSPINNTGYGLASINILRELAQIADVTYYPIGQPSVNNQYDHDLIMSLLRKRMEVDINAINFKIWHQFDLLEHIGRGKYIAYPFFELDTFNDYEKNNLKVPDSICVSSKWGQEVLLKNGIDSESFVVPLGVNRNIFNNTIKRTRSDDKYIFLNIGKWEVRKGHDILFSLFNKAFPDQKDVELWILASEKTNSYSSPDELKQWKNMYGSDRIKLFSGFDTQEEIAQLIANADCGLYPSRAEGWNLELLETMSMGKPAIATNYSAHTEFCTPDNCYLVNIDETEKAFDGKAFQGQGNWAKLGNNQIENFIEHMRYVYNNRINSNDKGIETAQKYSWSNSAHQVLRCMNTYS
jgi:glycosyltransferase involved in cell wall biosynthesis